MEKIFFLQAVCILVATISTISDGMNVDEMWKIIQKGDLDREKAHLPIDGEQSKNNSHIRESDILFDEEDEQAKREFIDKRQTQLPVLFDWHLDLWRTRVVPYTYSSWFSSADKKTIEDSMKEIESKVCLKFRLKSAGDTNWIDFYVGTGCFSGIGRKYWDTGSTRISLGNHCVNKPIVIHEVLHALGYYHEQSRLDRDSYVKTYMYNVVEAMASNFDKNKAGSVNYEGTPYDLKSIMQYGRTAFTTNGQTTMENKFDPNMPLGSSDLSETDVVELNKHYHCDVVAGWSSWSEYSPCIQQEWESYLCTRARVKICMGTSPCDGADSNGIISDVQDCKADPQLSSTCSSPAVDGVWSNWNDFTKCYSDSGCGLGVRSRTRSCSNPAPANGGKSCVGSFLQKELCRNQKCQGSTSAVDNNFSNGLGSWVSNDFVKRTGPGPYNNVGPREGVLGSEPYAVFSTPSSSYTETGKITSPRIASHSTGKKCFVFSYQLNGRNFPANSFSVYIQYYRPDGSKGYVNSFAVSGHQGNYWHRKGITINEINDQYEIVVEGKASGSDNEVAVDDFFLDDNACPIYWNDGEINQRTDCSSLAEDHCYSDYKLWMIKYCSGTCSECKDRHASCGKWSNERECIKNPKWMLWSCCKSCHDVCSNGQRQMCQDNADYVAQCTGWAERGECIKSKDWMVENCYKSCYQVLKN